MTRWQEFDVATMVVNLREQLARPLPGRTAQRAMAHSLAYGRHHGPIPDDARRAAVLVALHRAANGWSLPAIVRPETMKLHAGQVSLPGGMIEADETAAQAALREFEEELGTTTGELEVVGQLSPVYVFISGFEITPLVAVSPRPLVYQPNPHEVAEVLELPLSQLDDSKCQGRHSIERRGLEFTVPHFAIAGRQVWGATSLVLAEFLAVLNSLKPEPNLLPERTASRFAPG